MDFKTIQVTIADANILATQLAFTSTEGYDQIHYAKQVSDALTKVEVQSQVAQKDLEALTQQLRFLWLSDELEASKIRLTDIEILYAIQEGLKGEVTNKQLRKWQQQIKNCFTSPLKQTIQQQVAKVQVVDEVYKEESISTVSQKEFADELLSVMPVEFLNAGRIVRNYCLELVWNNSSQQANKQVKEEAMSIYERVIKEIAVLGQDNSESLVTFVQKYQMKPFATMDQVLVKTLYERTQQQLLAATQMMEVEHILKSELQKIPLNTTNLDGQEKQILSSNRENTTIQVLVGVM